MRLPTDKQLLLLLLQFLILLIAAQDFVPLVLGPDFQRAYDEKDILRGFKLNVQEGANPLKAHVFEGGVDSSPFSSSYTKSAVIASVDDVKEMMEIKGSLSVSYGPMISGSGAGSYLKDKVKSKRQVSVLYRTRRVAYAKKVDVKTLKPVDGLDRLEPDEILETYGSKFIDQILYGAQLDVIFTVESSEDTDFFEIEAELKGKIGVGALSVSFEAKFQQQEGSTQSRYSMNIEARASGIAFAVPSNPSFDQVNGLINDFNKQYEDMLDEVKVGETVDASNVANRFSPVAFALSPIAEYLPSKLSVEESSRFDDKMEALRDIFYHALFTKSQLNKIQGEQGLMYGEDPRVSIEIFEPYNDVVNDVTRELDDNIDECLAYRKLPVRTILEPSTRVPNKYADSAVEANVLKGLIGEAYIPSPVTVDGVTFEEFHYIGFALPGSTDAASLVPWMSGVLRHDDNDSVVASARTPDALAEMGLVEISSGEGHKYLKYGDSIFLQVSSLDYRWLKRDNITSKAMTKDYFPEVSQSARADYQWHVRSMVVSNLVAPDPKQGQCVKYGDVLFINSDTGEWLHRESPDECSVANFDDGSCVNTVAKDFQTARLQWKIRSTIGSGALAAEANPDPAHGQCIQLLSKIYLQSNNEENWWLAGGRSTGQESVFARDFYKTEGQTYTFSTKESKCVGSFAGVFSPSGSAVDRDMDGCMPIFMADCQDNGPITQDNNGLCLDYYIGGSSGCANTAIEPGYSLSRDWDIAPNSNGPQIEVMNGFLRYRVTNQNGRNLWLQMTAKRECSTSNGGCVLRFSVRCNQVKSSEVKFSLSGGVILRWTGSSFSYQFHTSGSGFTRLGSSSISPNGQWREIVMIVTSDTVWLLEDGLERFQKNRDVGANVTPRFSMQALDQGSDLSFDLKDIFVLRSCTDSTITVDNSQRSINLFDNTYQAMAQCHSGATCSLMHHSSTLDNEQWRFDSNTKELKSESNGQCLDLSSTGELRMQECLGGANQEFMFVNEQGSHRQSYEWILRKEVGNGLRDDGFFCPANTAKGSWKPIQSVDGAYRQIGIDRDIEFPYWEQTPSWEDSVTASVTSGFQFGNIKVPWIDAKEMEPSVRDVLHDLKFVDDGDAESGQTWQFVYEISDACAPMWELKTKDVVVTSDANHEPCCLPGEEFDPDQPHGPCKYQSACQCDDSVCNPASDTTSPPNGAPAKIPSPAGETDPAFAKDSSFGVKPTAYCAGIVTIVAAIVHHSV